MDGIDLAVIQTDGDAKIVFGATQSWAFSATQRKLLRQTLEDAKAIEKRDDRPENLVQIEAMVTSIHGACVAEFLASHNLAPQSIDIIGFHGQTVLHRPNEGLTVQLGNGQALAQLLKIPVAYDLRANDMVHGGQGAPLVPVFHRALVQAAKLYGPTAILNLGGIGNVTYCDGDAPPIAFDTGPANALMDDEMQIRFGLDLDRDGAMSGAGQVNQAALTKLMSHAYFNKPWPKSLDRQAFSREPVVALEAHEAIATLAAFTAESIRAAEKLLPQKPLRWILAGGGAFNPTLKTMIANRVAGDVVTSDSVDWQADMLEAQAWAYLAVRSLKGLELTFPTTTGCKEPVSGGTIARAE